MTLAADLLIGQAVVVLSYVAIQDERKVRALRAGSGRKPRHG